METKVKECCNQNCKGIFFIETHKFHQRDLCDKCIEKNEEKL